MTITDHSILLWFIACFGGACFGAGVLTKDIDPGFKAFARLMTPASFVLMLLLATSSHH